LLALSIKSISCLVLSVIIPPDILVALIKILQEIRGT